MTLVFFFPQSGVEHAHAFIFSPEAYRFCDVEQTIGGNHTLSQKHANSVFAYMLFKLSLDSDGLNTLWFINSINNNNYYYYINSSFVFF